MPWTGRSSLSLGLGQPWPCLDPIPLFALLFGIAFYLQLVLLSYHPIFLRPYHFLKLVSFLGANRTKSASVCPWMLRGAIELFAYNPIHNTIFWYFFSKYVNVKHKGPFSNGNTLASRAVGSKNNPLRYTSPSIR